MAASRPSLRRDYVAIAAFAGLYLALGVLVRNESVAPIAVVGLGVCIYLAWAGGQQTLHAFTMGERTESSWAPPKWPLFLSMPVGLGLTALQYVADLLRDFGSAGDGR